MTYVNLPALSMGSVTIHQHNGLYSLNDLHKASGGEPKNRPSLFLNNDQTKSLIAEIANAGIPAFESRRGCQGGTYACRELVISYASWISAEFHLKVIRVFLDQLSGNPGQLELAATANHDAPAIDATLVNEIVNTATRNIVETLKRKHATVDWQEVIAALQDRNCDIVFGDLTALIHACLNRLQRNVDHEAYVSIARRAANQGISTSQVSLNA